MVFEARRSMDNTVEVPFLNLADSSGHCNIYFLFVFCAGIATELIDKFKNDENDFSHR